MRPFVYRTCILALLATLAIASSGDRSPEFRNCISTCTGNRCHPWATLPVDLRLTRWTCIDDCKYNCMHMLTDNAVQSAKDIQQYYGKWPFWRFMGMQEPASVVFSLWNMWSHIQGARQIHRRVPVAHPMRSYYLVCAYVSINAWIWSAVFHTRGAVVRFRSPVGLTSQYRLASNRETRLFLSSIGNHVCAVSHSYPHAPLVPSGNAQPEHFQIQ